jgi:phosphoesterase RecJ-like protein
VTSELLAVPAHRRETLGRIIAGLRSSDRIILTTHVNADGDGAGCEAAVLGWLRDEGKQAHIVNPTPYPEPYRHLIQHPDAIADPNDPRQPEILSSAQTVLVLDTGEPKRIGRILGGISGKSVFVIDHHPPTEPGFRGVALLDPIACATGELVFDLFHIANVPEPWPRTYCEGIYTAIVTDTGSFRFSNTTERTHVIAGDLLRRGIDPEAAYRRLFATVPLRRVALLRAALESLRVDDELPITWLTIPRNLMVETGATAEDLEGLVDHARDVQGTEVALLFRETSDGGTKVSLRSNGDVDVNAVARQFGGGGHIKASGAVVAAPLDEAVERVLEATRAAVRATTTRAE